MSRLPNTHSMRRWHARKLLALFFFVLVVAVGICWFTMTIRDQRKQKAAADAIRAAGGVVSAEQTWLGKLLGDDSLTTVVTVVLADESVSEDVVACLRDTNQLIALALEGPRVTDDMLINVRELSQLKWLALNRTSISDDGLTHLRDLSQLTFLFLNETEVTDAGLVHLSGLDLCWLELGGTNVTARGVRRLERALPSHCLIELESSIASPARATRSGPLVRQLYPPAADSK